MCFSTPSPVSHSEFSPPPAPRRGQRRRVRRDAPSTRFSMRPAFEAETDVDTMVLDHESGYSHMRHGGSDEDGDDELSEEEQEDKEVKGIGLHGVQHDYAFSLHCKCERHDTSISYTTFSSSPPMLPREQRPATVSTSTNTPEAITKIEIPVEDHASYPRPAPRISCAVPIPTSSPNVPPPYVRRPITVPISFTWESPERQVHGHIEEHLENQRRRQAQNHHQHAQQTKSHYSRTTTRMFSSSSSYSSPVTGTNSSPAKYGSSLIYDTTGTDFSSSVPSQRGVKRHRDLVDDGDEE